MGVLRSYEPTTSEYNVGPRWWGTNHLEPGWLEENQARAWSDQRYRDYRRKAQIDSYAAAGLDDPAPDVHQARQSTLASRWRRVYPERLRDAGDLERAAAIPVPDDNRMNLYRRIAG